MIAGRLEIELLANVARLSQDVNQAKGMIGGMARDVNRSVEQMKGMFGGLARTIVAAFGVRQMLVMTDQFTKFTAQLQLATRSQTEYGRAVGEVRRISNLAQADLQQTGVLYARITNATRDLGLSQGRVSDITETVSLALKASGASGAEAASAMLQLSQAFASGTLRGEEFNAVNEAAPRLMRALAEGMGVPIGSLREMAKEGKITSAVMAEALPKSINALREEAEKVQTLAGAFQVLKNSIMEFVGAGAQSTGIVAAISRELTGMGTVLNEVNRLMPEASRNADQINASLSPLAEAFRAVVVLGGNVAFVIKAIGIEIGGWAAQLANLFTLSPALRKASGEGAHFAEISRMMKADAEAARKEFDEWERRIMGVGTAASKAKPELQAMDQVSRRIASEEAAREREALERARKAVQTEKEREAAAKAAAKARLDRAQAEIDAEEMFSQDYYEAWEAVYAQRTAAAEVEAQRRIDQAAAELKAEEMFAQDYVEAWKYANAFILEEDRKRQEQEREFAKGQFRFWSEVGDLAGGFFADLVTNGKSAFDNLKRYVKDLLAEMIALFAKRWILNLAAGGSVLGSATSAASGLSDTASLAGSAFNLVGAGATFALGTTGAGALGATAGGAFAQGAMGVGAGVWAPGSAGAMGSAMSGVYSALAAIPVWGWIAMAVVAIGAWIAGNHKGGPKVGGSFFSGGAVPGTDNGRFFTPNQGDSVVQQMVEATSTGYVDAITRLGGTAGGFNFGLGFDHDPAGTAMSRVSSLVTDAQGNEIYGVRDLEMDDKEVEGALGLEMQRMLVAALQNSDLHAEILGVLNTVDVATATGEQLGAVLAQAVEMKQIIDVLALWNIEGLDVGALRAMNREGEKLTDTLNALAQSQATYYDLFFTEEENRARLQEQLTKQFADLGLELPETREGFRALVEGLDLTDDAQAKLYRALLELAPAFAELVPTVEDVGAAVVETVKAINAAYMGDPTSMARDLVGGFDQRFGGVMGGGSLMDRLGLRSAIATDQIGENKARMTALEQQFQGLMLPTEWFALKRANEMLSQQVKDASRDIATLTTLTAQYGDAAAEQVFELDKWYQEQRRLVAGNQAALLALDELYADKREAIFEQAIADAAGPRSQLAEWINRTLLNPQVTTLTPMQRLDEARAQYETLLSLSQEGDAGAISQLSGSADAYLKIAREIFASSASYNAIFGDVMRQTGAIAGMSPADVDARLAAALPTSGQLATGADIADLKMAVYELTTVLVERGITTSDPATKAAVDKVATKLDAAASTGLLIK